MNQQAEDNVVAIEQAQAALDAMRLAKAGLGRADARFAPCCSR